MMPFGSECCKGSKLLVDLFLESYTRCTSHKLLVDLFLESYTRCTSHNGILKNCTVANIAIKAFLRV